MPAPSPFSPPSNTWGPYANAGDFKGNLLIIFTVLFCVLLIFIAFNSIIRFFLCRCRLPIVESVEPDPEKPKERKSASPVELQPALLFSKGMKLAGNAAECAICLSEFIEGEGVRALPDCNHGFHVKCVEKWLALRSSCPTCRRTLVVGITMEITGVEEV